MKDKQRALHLTLAGECVLPYAHGCVFGLRCLTLPKRHKRSEGQVKVNSSAIIQNGLMRSIHSWQIGLNSDLQSDKIPKSFMSK